MTAPGGIADMDREAGMKQIHFSENGIAVDWDGKRLSLEVDGFRRVMECPHGAPRTVSLRGPDGSELAAAGNGPDLSLGGMIPAGPGEEWHLADIRLRRRRKSALYPAHIEVEVLMTDPVRRADYRREFRSFPGIPAFFVTNSVRSEVTMALYPGRLRQDDAGPDFVRHRPPSVHHPGGRRHPGDAGRKDRRTRHP